MTYRWVDVGLFDVSLGVGLLVGVFWWCFGVILLCLWWIVQLLRCGVLWMVVLYGAVVRLVGTLFGFCTVFSCCVLCFVSWVGTADCWRVGVL